MEDNQKVSLDKRSIIINGQRRLLISGAVHYPRSTPAMWPKILRQSKQAGLNCVETYVFWEGHEPQEGKYCFRGRYNLRYFLELCQRQALYVFLRIGPYICAETNFGGLPWWLITKKGLVTRTWNRPFMEAVEKWLRVLMAQIGDCQITRGGPIILVQLENEYEHAAQRYGKEGQKYLTWCGDELGKRVGIEVPITMCRMASRRALATLNDFSAWENAKRLLRKRPLQPAIWTENWTGWYNLWNQAHHYRLPEEIAYEVIRFFAVGGSGVNYYMWHGGTNFDRDAMYLQTTSYDFSAPIDEYGLPTSKLEHLKRLHQCLHHIAPILWEGKRARPQIIVRGPLEGNEKDSVLLYSVEGKKGQVAFVVNATFKKQVITVPGLKLSLPARSALVLSQKGREYTVIYRSWVKPEKPINRQMVAVKAKLKWEMIAEPSLGKGVDQDREFSPVRLPHNMLLETGDETDFGWYRRIINSRKDSLARLTCPVSDLLSVWVNGNYIGSSPPYLQEFRLKKSDFEVEMEIPLKRGRNEVVLLVTAMGMIKGGWMINAPQSEEKKGLLGAVALDNKRVSGVWEFSAGTWGERIRIYDPGVASLASWQRPSLEGGPLRWYRATFELAPRQFHSGGPWALEIGKLFKGLIWVNGRGIGRFWQQPSPSKTDLSPPHHPFVLTEGFGNPPQHYYHIPPDWLRAGRNTIIILEERGAVPEGCALFQRK